MTLVTRCMPFLLTGLIVTTGVFYYLWANKSSLVYANTDFYSFYQSMRFYFSGQSLYSNLFGTVFTGHFSSKIHVNNNLNPPFLTLLLLPFYAVGYAEALKIWTVCSMLAMLFSVTCFIYHFTAWRKQLISIVTAFAIYTPNQTVFLYGQISQYILLLLVFAFLLGAKNKPTQDILAGILIGIACAIKIFCGLFLIYFLMIRRFKLFFSSVITIFLAFLASVWVFGVQNYIAYQAILKSIFWYSASWNASFLGFFSRIFSAVEKNTPMINLPHVAHWLVIFFSSILIIYIFFLWTTRCHQNFELGFSLVIISMLLLSPLGWVYYFGFLIIPYCVIVSQSRHDSVHFISCIVLFFSSLSGNLLKTWEIRNVKQIFYNGGLGFYTLMALLILCIYIIYQPEKKNTVIFSEKSWLLIYFTAFLPSGISFLSNVFIL